MKPSQPLEPEHESPSVAEATDPVDVEVGAVASGPAGTHGPPTRRRRRWRQILVVILAVITLLCLGGLSTVFIFYDRTTRPDLSSPVLVTREYLSAYLVQRDDFRASRFRCADDSELADVWALRSDDDERAKKYSVAITVAVDSVRETSRTGNDARVAVDLVFSTTLDGQPQRELEHWEFVAHNDNGWRVCSGHEVT